jgi:hypothetical protein
MKRKIDSTGNLYGINDCNQILIGYLYETFQDHDENLDEKVLSYFDQSSHLFLDLSVENIDEFLCERAVNQEKDIKSLETRCLAKKLKVIEELEWIKANSTIVFRFSQVVLKYTQLSELANEVKDLNDIIALVSVFTELLPDITYIIDNQKKLGNELKEKLFKIIDNLNLLMVTFNLKLGQYLQIKLLAQIQSDDNVDKTGSKPARVEEVQARDIVMAETINQDLKKTIELRGKRCGFYVFRAELGLKISLTEKGWNLNKVDLTSDLEPEKDLIKTSPLIEESFFTPLKLIMLDESELEKNEGIEIYLSI